MNKINNIDNIDTLKEMLSKLAEVEDSYYDIEILDFDISIKASFILTRIKAVSHLIEDVIEDLEKDK